LLCVNLVNEVATVETVRSGDISLEIDTLIFNIVVFFICMHACRHVCMYMCIIYVSMSYVRMYPRKRRHFPFIVQFKYSLNST